MKSQRFTQTESKGPPSSGSRSESVVKKVASLADAGQLEQAIHQLASSNLLTGDIRNARGVCLMRMGRVDDAVQLYRSLVLMSGCTWMMPNLPVIYRTNFATALLMSGRRIGCLDCLLEITERDHPSVVRLRKALRDWEHGFDWRQWLCWKIGVEPRVPVALSFPPGDFFEPDSSPPLAGTAAQHPQLAI